MHQSVDRILYFCLILALLTNTAGCYHFRQIPVTTTPGEETTKSDKTPMTIDELLLTLTVNKARIKVVLRDAQVIVGRAESFSDPYLQVKKGKQIIDIDKGEIAEVHKNRLDIMETTQWSLGIIASLTIIYAISKLGDLDIKELDAILPDFGN
jgi:hypothetical protein